MLSRIDCRTVLIVASAALLWAHVAAAGPGYQLNGFITDPTNAPKVLAATDKLQDSAIMKESKGRLLLLANLADGGDPATHSFVILFKSNAEYESFSKKLQVDPAWAEFLGTISTLGQGAATLRVQIVRSWGDISDEDVVWQNFLFSVSNPAAFLAAHERFMQSKTGKAFPGQVHVNAILAGGISSVTHGIVVGYESEAEMEAWNDANANNPEWAAFLGEIALSSEFRGSNLSRTIKAWGPASMKSIVTR